MPRKAVGRRQHPKARHELIPANALHQVALAFAYGEEKHKDNPKEKGRSWRGEFGALLRHAWAPVRGNFYDPETGLCHWAHAAARALILLEFFITEVGQDDLTPGKQKEKTMRRKISSGVRALLGTAMAFGVLMAALAFTQPVRAETVWKHQDTTVFIVPLITMVGGLVVNEAMLEYPDRSSCALAMILMATKAGSENRPYCEPAIRDEMGDYRLLNEPPDPKSRDSPERNVRAPT